MRSRRLLPVAGAVVGGALLLGACGTSSHVVSDVASGSPRTSLTSTPHASGDEAAANHGTKSSSAKSTSTTVKGRNPVTGGSTAPPTSGSSGSGSSGTSRNSGTPGSSGSQPNSPVNQQMLNALDAQLGALGQSLSQAVSDVNNTQGDS